MNTPRIHYINPARYRRTALPDQRNYGAEPDGGLSEIRSLDGRSFSGSHDVGELRDDLMQRIRKAIDEWQEAR